MKRIVTLTFILFILISVHASDNGIISGEFLLMPIGPKAMSLGNAMIGYFDDPISVFYNPANSSLFPAAAVSLGQTKYIFDTHMEYFSFSIPFSKNNYFGVGVNVFYTDPIDVYTWDSPEESFEQYDVSDNNLYINYARRFGNLSIGLNGKFYKEEIANVISNTFLIDFGVNYKMKHGIFGFAVQNLGKGLVFDNDYRTIDPSSNYEPETEKLPVNIVFGGSYKPIKNLLILIQGNSATKNGFNFSAGLEYKLFNIIPLRVGYTNVDNGGLGFGFGLNYTFTKTKVTGEKVDVLTLDFDYSYVPYDDLGDVQILGMTLLFR